MKRDPSSLQLINSELDRELQDIAARQSNALTRASIVFAAAGLTGFIAGSTVLAASILAVAAGGAALVATFLWNSRAVVVTKDVVGAWIVAGPVALSERIILDKLRELEQSRSDLDWKNRGVAASIVFVVLSWIVAGVAFATAGQ